MKMISNITRLPITIIIRACIYRYIYFFTGYCGGISILHIFTYLCHLF